MIVIVYSAAEHFEYNSHYNCKFETIRIVIFSEYRIDNKKSRLFYISFLSKTSFRNDHFMLFVNRWLLFVTGCLQCQCFDIN